MNEERKIPAGRFGRLARLAAIGARSGVSMLAGGDGASTAKAAADVLGTLRGLAAKMGQMASYVDGIVPEAQRDAYESALKALRAQAPKSSSAAIRALVESELKGTIESLFAEWDDTPVASASIGQVHRAVLHDGAEVAVKVQHPGVVQAIESDLSNAGIVEAFAGTFMGKRFDTKAMLDVIRTRFREELDYALEAERLSLFARLHEGDPHVSVPRLHETHSSKRVLTTAFVHGMTFEEACAGSVDERRAWAETMWRFVFKGTLVGGHLNADPHPGNYIFKPDGGVAFVDYGCIQPFIARRPKAVQVHKAALAKDETAFKKAVATMVGSKPGALEDLAIAYTRRCFEPLFSSPYRIEKSYAASLVDGFKEMSTAARKAKDHEFFTMPPDMIFVNRLQFGFYSVLARLDVTVDFAAVERAFMPSE